MKLRRSAPEPPAPRKKPKKSRPWLRRSLGVLLAVLIAIVVGFGAIVAVGALAAQPALFLTAGLVVFLAVAALGIGLATKPVSRAGRITTYVVAVLLVVGVVVVTCGPFGRHRYDAATPVAGMRYWDLPTGSRLAYVHIAARGTRRPTPVVVLHGGPGVADLAGDTRFFRPLADDGFDVYVYDQVGAGHSGRLTDPGNYSLGRDVADLEAIRRQIGARTVSLVADSAGTRLAATYMAQHPGAVQRAALASPVGLAPGDSSGNRIGRLSNDDLRGLVGQLARPRALLAYTLMQVNGQAAHNFAGDREMDTRFDRMYHRSAGALHCADTKAKAGRTPTGLGYYANGYPQSAAAHAPTDPRSALRRVPTNTLVIKGSCDYLPWSTATEYTRALPHATLEYVHDAGQDLYADQPTTVLGLIRAFLGGRPLPAAAYTGAGKPGDYQGPR